MIKSIFIVNGSNDVIYEKHFDKVFDKGALVPFYDKLSTQQYRNIPPVINCNTYCLFQIAHEVCSLHHTAREELTKSIVASKLSIFHCFDNNRRKPIICCRIPSKSENNLEI